MTETFNPEMLMLARESRGETQSSLSKESGIAQHRLSRLESGIAEARADELAQLASTLHYPTSFFCREGGLVAPGTDSFHHRQKHALTVADRKRNHAKLRLRRLELRELMRDVEIECRDGFRPMDLDDFNGNVEKLAETVRANWGLPPGPVLDLTGTIERSGGIVYHCEFDTNKLDAVSQLCSPLPALFFVNIDVPADRMRWNLAHELGHLLMHHDIHPNAETEANRFAAAFLMPRSDIIQELPASLDISMLLELKMRWKVAMSALVRRAKELGTITESHAASLFFRMSRRGWRTSEPGRFPIERPALLDSILALQRGEHGYTIDELAQRVSLHASEFARLYFPGEARVRLVR